jgi:hypothetical protein
MKQAFAFLFFAVALLPSSSVQGQTGPGREPIVVQLSGLVVAGDSLAPVPYATIRVKDHYRGSITDHMGFFSMPVYSTDTLIFSAIGYRTTAFTFTEGEPNRKYSIVQVMRRDTVQLPTTYVYPWPTPENFKREFLALDITDDPQIRAQKALARILIEERYREMDMDDITAYRMAVRTEADRSMYRYQQPTISLLNPFAWAQFIQAWRNGDFKAKD